MTQGSALSGREISVRFGLFSHEDNLLLGYPKAGRSSGLKLTSLRSSQVGEEIRKKLKMDADMLAGEM